MMICFNILFTCNFLFFVLKSMEIYNNYVAALTWAQEKSLGSKVSKPTTWYFSPHCNSLKM